jgi:hypothetical protein
MDGKMMELLHAGKVGQFPKDRTVEVLKINLQIQVSPVLKIILTG